MLALFLALQGFVPIPPNVAVVVLDDVGTDQLACYDDANHYSEDYPYANTPNLTALASASVRFTRCHAGPICSPTRAMILTGRYPFRTGAGALVRPADATPTYFELGSPFPETCLPALLSGPRKAIGKWHLGNDAADGGTMPFHPLYLGFSSWSGIARNIDGGGDLPPSPGYYSFLWWDSGVATHVTGAHATGYTADRAIDWISDRSPVVPWFLYLCFNAPHDPWKPSDMPPSAEHGFGAPKAGEVNTAYRALLESVDFHLGRVLAVLPENTIVFVLGDNGTPQPVLTPAQGECRYPTGHPLWQAGDESAQLSLAPYDALHGKNGVYEQGTRVPLLVSGPGLVSATIDDQVDTVDLFATVCALRGVSVPSGVANDSISFLPLLHGAQGGRFYSFSQRFTPNGIDQDYLVEMLSYTRTDGTHYWKIVSRGGTPDEFYDLFSDPLEASDLGTGHPEYQDTADDLAMLLGS